MVEMRNKKTQGRSAPTKDPKRLPVPFQFSEGMVPLVVLGFSVVSLGLAVYGISSGHVQQYALNHKNEQVVYASERTTQNKVSSSPLSKGTSASKATVSNGSRSNSDDSVNVEDTGLSVEEQAVITKYREDAHDKAVIAEQTEKIEAEKEAAKIVEAEKVAEQERVEAEKIAIKEKASSMRLRIQPDRDLGDIYYYVVEAGDTLASLSQHFNLSMGQLMEENHIAQANNIYVGEVIFMPADYAPAG